MTAQDSSQAHPTATMDDDEVDLRRYVGVLIAWWKEILLVGVACALLAGGVILIIDRVEPAEYVAQSDIVVARLVNEITMDTRFRTQADDMGVANAANSRRAALIELVKNGAIATAVAEELDPAVFDEELTPATLLDMVEAEMPLTADGRNSSDLIRIYASADTPEKAAIIANSWAQHYVEQINTVYGSVPAEVFRSVQTELESSGAAHEAAQRELEMYIATSPIDTLARQITEAVTLRDNYQLGHTAVISTVISQDRNARLELFSSLAAAQETGRNLVLGQQTAEQNHALTDRYLARAQARSYLAHAQNLLEQVRRGGDAAAASNALALQLLKAQTFALADNLALPANLYLNVDASAPADAKAQEADVKALITALEGYIERLDSEIETASLLLLNGRDYSYLDRFTADALAATAPYTVSEMVQPTTTMTDDLNAAIFRSYQELFGLGGMAQVSATTGAAPGNSEIDKAIAKLDRSIQVLRAEFAAEESKQRLLMQKRDVAWSTYEALSNKAAELNLERSAVNSEVRMGALAVPPELPVGGSSARTAAVIGGVLGLMLGIFLAFIADYLGKPPFLGRSRLQPA